MVPHSLHTKRQRFQSQKKWLSRERSFDRQVTQRAIGLAYCPLWLAFRVSGNYKVALEDLALRVGFLTLHMARIDQTRCALPILLALDLLFGHRRSAFRPSVSQGGATAFLQKYLEQ